MLRVPQHERKILRDVKASSVRPEHRRKTPTESFSNLLVEFNYSVAQTTIEMADRNENAAASRGRSLAAGVSD